MITPATITELLQSEPFHPFRIVTSSGESYVIRNPEMVVPMKTRVFLAQPRSDKSAMVPYLHISGLETVGNGAHGKSARRRRKHG